MNDERLKNLGDGVYFEELLERIRSIRSSDKDILTHAGKISYDDAMIKAHSEYEKYQKRVSNELSEVEKHYLNSIKKIRRNRRKCY